MNDKITSAVHWSFWLISVLGLIWNGLGGVNFIMQMNPEVVASFPETHRAIIEGRPLWATAGFAIAVFGGAIGCLLLLLRKAVASLVLIASFLGAAFTMIHTVGIALWTIDFSTAELFVMAILPLIVGAFLIWYSKLAQTKGWIG